MKNTIQKISFLLLFLFSIGLKAQVSTEPSEDIKPDEPLKIIVDISKLDASLDHVVNLQTAAADGEDLYIWTWSPAEHPVGHPLTNGLGAQAWKNSNDSLKMTLEAPNIYSYTLTPTEFYEVDAATVYANDIHFLVKPKDGGGFGDPDRKSEDLSIPIDPPSLERDPSYIFPSFARDKDVIAIIYENDREGKESMQNLGSDECYFFTVLSLSDSTTMSIASSFFTAGSNPLLKMDYVGGQTFKKIIQPHSYFNIPDGISIVKMDITMIRKTYSSSADRASSQIEFIMNCE
tara:strand:+ start:4074 stop:4943 length:870 start_codon:yes stop_codon:yes gene_type:complete